MGLGGAQKVVEGIVGYYDSQDYVYCYALRENSFSSNYKKIITRNTNSKYDLMSIHELKSIIKKNNIQILHCHLLKSFFIGYVVKKLYFKDIKLIFHEHGKIFRNQSYYNFFLNYVQGDVDLFIGVSRATKYKLINYAKIPREKIKVLYNFVDLENLNLQFLDEYESDKTVSYRNESGFIIGFAGRLDSIKGCEYLIKAVSYLLIPNVKLLIAGEGKEKKKLMELAEHLQVNKNIIFLGYVKQMLNFYKKIDVLVVPSEFESFGIAVIEAQACGVPVIASDVESLNEIIKNGDDGLLFEFGNAKDLAKNIDLIYTNHHLKNTLRIHGINNAQKYSRRYYISTLEDIYQSLFN
ncbi:glycosyltransferase family 4 protein [Methanosarcina sp. KYL-1]|uniref:glycosyltransferase family 4 protein n=1 Tax=Methanosarcina sp. KYL-1 TaxID=2602068 RepID=UPI002100EE72|nr:glycosyltransferase family 4 protein [Methanosarcina sp. KYL-1]